MVQQGNGRIRINSDFLANPSEVFNAADFDSIEIFLFAGNDSFIIPSRFSIPITIDAGADQTTPPADNGQPKKTQQAKSNQITPHGNNARTDNITGGGDRDWFLANLESDRNRDKKFNEELDSLFASDELLASILIAT